MAEKKLHLTSSLLPIVQFSSKNLGNFSKCLKIPKGSSICWISSLQQASSAKLLGCMPRIQYKDAPRNLEVSNRCVGKTPSMQLVTWPRSSVTKRKSSCMAQVKRRTKRIAALALLAAVPKCCRWSSRVSRLQKCIKCNWHGMWLYMVRSCRQLSSTIWLLPQGKKKWSMMQLQISQHLAKIAAHHTFIHI